MDSKEMAEKIVSILDEKKAVDIEMIPVAEKTVLADYFVIATGANTPQVEAILDNIEEKVRIEGGVKPISRQQTNDHSWELLDYGEFVVDVFQPESRDFYRLETLWGDAPINDIAEAGICFLTLQFCRTHCLSGLCRIDVKAHGALIQRL